MAARKTTSGRLRAVGADETPPRARRVAKKPLTVEQAAASGDHRKLLVALRDRISKTVADPLCPPRDLAALSKRLTDIAKEIEDIDLRAKEAEDEDATAPDEEFDASAI